MNSRFVCVALSALAAGFSYGASQSKLMANAGTGPYNFGVQTGWTESSGQRGFLVRLNGILSIIRPTVSGGSFPSTLRPPSSPQLAQSTPLSAIKKVLDDFKRFSTDYAKQFKDLEQELKSDSPQIETLRDSLQLLQAAVAANVAKDERGQSMTVLHTGLFVGPRASYEFNNLTVSSGEQGAGKARLELYFMGGAYEPLNLSGVGTSGRVGLGIGFGDPNRLVGSVSGASYISPRSFDAAANVSVLLKSASSDTEITRTLVDHIRPKDVWLTVTGRQISDSKDTDLLANGSMLEGELTFALRPFVHGTKSVPTLSLSGIYAEKKELGVDELGAEIRTPLSNHTFSSLRYGTRGHLTVSFEFKL